MRKNLRENLREKMRENLRENIRENMRENLRENLRENRRENLRENLGENLREVDSGARNHHAIKNKLVSTGEREGLQRPTDTREAKVWKVFCSSALVSGPCWWFQGSAWGNFPQD